MSARQRYELEASVTSHPCIVGPPADNDDGSERLSCSMLPGLGGEGDEGLDVELCGARLCTTSSRLRPRKHADVAICWECRAIASSTNRRRRGAPLERGTRGPARR